MTVQNIAIVGLGRVGDKFLNKLFEKKDLGMNILCVSEPSDTPGRRRAEELCLAIVDNETLIDFGDQVDVIFDLSGDPTTRRHLREMLKASGNTHTAIAPESVAHCVWSLLTDEPLPGNHRTGY